MRLESWWNASLPWAVDLQRFVAGLGSEFRGSRAKLGWQDGVIAICTLAVIVLGIIALSRYLARYEQQRRTDNPWGLFHELCKAHQLDFASRWALRRLAKFHRLKHPALLFLEAQRFDDALEHPLLARDRGRLLQVRARLFPESN